MNAATQFRLHFFDAIMRWCAFLCLASAFVSQSNAIFADDAFQVDYHHALLGLPLSHTTCFHQPQSSSNASLLYTISDKAVLGAVNPKDGTLLWRQALAEQPVLKITKSFLVALEDGEIISGHGQTISAWDALDGKLVWTKDIPADQVILGLDAILTAGQSTGGPAQDVIALTGVAGGQSTITRVAGDGSGSIWEHIDRSGDEPLAIAVTNEHVHYISKSTSILSSGKVKVTVLSSANGDNVRQYSPTVGSDHLGVGGEYAVGSGSNFPFLASTESPFSSLKFNLLGSTKSSTLPLDDKHEEVERLSIHFPREAAKPHFLVHIWGKSRHWAEVFHIDPRTGDVTKAYNLPATAEKSVFAASSVGDTVYFTRVTDSEVSLWSSESHGYLGRWPRRGVTAEAGTASSLDAHAVSEVVVRGKTGIAVRVAEASGGGEWNLIRNGEIQWTRPEILADVVLAVWAHDVDQSTLAAELEVEVSSNPLTAYSHRLKRHAQDLFDLPGYVRRVIESLLQTSPTTVVPTSKNMAGDKTVIVATSRREVLAIDAANAGAIKWRVTLPQAVGSVDSIVSLSVREGRITTYLSDGSFVVLDLHIGRLIEQKDGSIPMDKLVEVQGHLGSTFIKVDHNGIPRLALDYAHSTATEGNTLVTISKDGEALGWTVGQSIERTWTFRPAGVKIVSAVGRPSHDPVASIGKVLGDRSVLYKYLSPNLALLTAISETSDNMSLYLIDSVTGAILHTSTHQGIDKTAPVSSAISENWFAYSFSAKDPESLAISSFLVVSDLLESASPNDRGALGQSTNYSTFEPGSSTKPHVSSQAFTIAEPISHMSVTQTGQGITSRQLLCTLPNSGSLIGIPRHLLDPRRTVDRDPTAVEAEEGLLRYSPVLDLDPKLFLTHSREVIGINKIMSSPSLLESTSFVFGFGHDIFGTTVTPSMAFDVLGKGFNKVSLLLTVVALWAGVLVLAPMARSRQVEGRWKG